MFLCTYHCTGASVSLDLCGGDFLKVNVAAAAVDLIVLHVLVLQLQAQIPHHSLKVTISAVHLDVILLQLFLVADYLGGWSEEAGR